MKVICPYCNKKAELVRNERFDNYKWVCTPCDASVGCHKSTTRPLGTLANKELRGWRIKTHNYIDALWKHHNKGITRAQMYKQLQSIFGREIHVGEADIEMCKKIMSLSLKRNF